MVYEGARANLFEVSIAPATPGDFTATDLNFFAKSSIIPGATLGAVSVPYFGREVKFAGNRTYGDWTITVINDENYFHRAEFEKWMSNINTVTTNLRTSANYLAEGTVKQYGKDGTAKADYHFVNIFPIDLGEISLDWGDNDSIEEYTVTFAYDYWYAGEQAAA
jgi:hypothetical protein